MWVCPECGRKFARNNQSHSCERNSLEALLFGKNPRMIDLFNHLTTKINELGENELFPGKYNITFRRLSTFLSVLIERDHLTLVFLHRYPIDDFPVFQNYHHSANRWSNSVKIESADEIDEQLMGWLREAYELAG